MKTTTESTPPKTPEDVLNELRALLSEAEKILDQDTGNEAGNLDDEFAALRERFEAARDRITEACAGVRRKVVDRARQTDEMIRENPYQSVAVAAAVGLVVGMLLNRRSN